MDRQIYDISWGSLWRVLLMLIFAIALYFLRDVLMILATALVISSALDAPVSFLESKKIPRILGTILIFLAVLLVLAALLYTIVPVAITEFGHLFEKLEELEIPAFGSFSPQVISNWRIYLGNLTDLLFAGSASFFEIAGRIFGGLAFMVAVLVISFYLTISRDGVEKFLRAVLPSSSEEYVVKIYLSTRQKLGRWLGGQLILSLIVGAMVFLGLWILGVRYSLILGILAGILELVPYVGPIFIGIVAFLLAISESWILGISTAALFLIIQQLENNLIIPAVMRKAVGLHPLVVVISMLAGFQIAGFLGLILAVPTAVVIQEIIENRAAKKDRA